MLPGLIRRMIASAEKLVGQAAAHAERSHGRTANSLKGLERPAGARGGHSWPGDGAAGIPYEKFPSPAEFHTLSDSALRSRFSQLNRVMTSAPQVLWVTAQRNISLAPNSLTVTGEVYRMVPGLLYGQRNALVAKLERVFAIGDDGRWKATYWDVVSHQGFWDHPDIPKAIEEFNGMLDHLQQGAVRQIDAVAFDPRSARLLAQAGYGWNTHPFDLEQTRTALQRAVVKVSSAGIGKQHELSDLEDRIKNGPMPSPGEFATGFGFEILKNAEPWELRFAYQPTVPLSPP